MKPHPHIFGQLNVKRVRITNTTATVDGGNEIEDRTPGIRDEKKGPRGTLINRDIRRANRA